MKSAGAGAPAVVVEHYWPRGTSAAFARAAAQLQAAVDEVAHAGGVVRLLHATFVPDEGSAFCVFSCSSPELVEEAYRRAALPFDRILGALEIMPAHHGDPSAAAHIDPSL
jgi:hypothetical protein